MIDPASIAIADELLIAHELWKFLRKQMSRLIASKSDRFLDYDPGSLRKLYADERPVAPALTYVLASDLIRLHRAKSKSNAPILVQVEVAKKTKFELSAGTSSWARTSAAGFEALVDSGRVTDNESLVRVSNYDAKPDSLVLSVQQAQYHDQARSNLVLDFDRQEPTNHLSLRSQLHAKYGECLPDLSDRRLANTLGAAILIFYRSGGQWVPYLVRRVKKIGVFPGGVHCSASGAVKWAAGRPSVSFEDVTEHMLDEVQEELGLLPHDLVDLRPVAFCREMARGGKPQLFYCARTNLSRSELSERRKHAARTAQELNLWQEIERDRWYRSADVVMSPSRLRHGLVTWGVTLEGAASLFFGYRYMQDVVAHPSA